MRKDCWLLIYRENAASQTNSTAISPLLFMVLRSCGKLQMMSPACSPVHVLLPRINEKIIAYKNI